MCQALVFSSGAVSCRSGKSTAQRETDRRGSVRHRALVAKLDRYLLIVKFKGGVKLHSASAHRDWCQSSATRRGEGAPLPNNETTNEQLTPDGRSGRQEPYPTAAGRGAAFADRFQDRYAALPAEAVFLRSAWECFCWGSGTTATPMW